MKYSDIIDEIILQKSLEVAQEKLPFRESKYKGKFGLEKNEFFVKTSEHEKLLNLPVGHYAIVNFKNLLYASNSEVEYLVNFLSRIIKKQLKSISENSTILVVALGNKHISADSLGASTIRNVIVTRELKKDIQLFEPLPNISVFSAGVLGVTGIESGDVVKGIIDQIKPNKLIVIDTLCATNFKRLGTSFQINNAGIVPGSGIGNARNKISKTTHNVDVISIGVPLVVYAKSFVNNAVNSVKENEILKHFNNSENEAKKVVEAYKIELLKLSFDDLILTVKDIEDTVKICGRVIGFAINKALTGLSVEEQKEYLELL